MQFSRASLRAGPDAPPSAQSPYRLLFHQDPVLSLVTAAKWSNYVIAKEWTIDAPKGQRGPHATLSKHGSRDRPVLHVAYVSRRHHDYPGTQLMLRVFGSHNRSRTDVRAYSTGPNDKSGYRTVIRNNVDTFVDILPLSPAEGAEVLLLGPTDAGAPVDIVVDYDGAHDFNNLALLTRLRNAADRTRTVQPIVVTWLGFASTTGLGNRPSTGHVTAKYGRGMQLPPGVVPPVRAPIDFIFADSTILPPDSGAARATTEHLVFLPGGCYQPQDEYQAADAARGADQSVLAHIREHRAPELSPLPTVEDKLALKLDFAIRMGVKSADAARFAQHPWIACLNRVSKITPEAFHSYLQLLNAVAEARLVLLQDSDDVTRELKRVAVSHGVRPARLLFFPRAPKVEYMQLLSVCAMFVDTRAYGSHTVGSDAMHMGLPLLTLPGVTMASRVGASLNGAADTPEMVAYTEKEWLSVGQKLLRNSALLQLMHDKVAKSARGVGNTRMFNSTVFAEGLERAYHGMRDLGHITGEKHVAHHLFFDSNLRGARSPA